MSASWSSWSSRWALLPWPSKIGGDVPLSRVGFSCSRLGSPTRLSPPLLLPLTFFLFLFGFAWRFLMRGQLTGPWFCPKTAYRAALLLKQGHQDQPYALSKTTRESWPRLLGGDAPGNMLLRQGLQSATRRRRLGFASHAHHP